MDMTDMTRAAVSRRHFLQLAGAGMLALTGTALAGCGNSTSGEGSDKGSKLAAIKSRGHLNAGVKKDVPGYGYYDTAKGRFEGMEVDLCYQIAAAVFAVFLNRRYFLARCCTCVLKHYFVSVDICN